MDSNVASTTWSSGGATIYSDGISYDPEGNVISRATTQAAIPGVSSSGGSEVSNFCEQSERVNVRVVDKVQHSFGSHAAIGVFQQRLSAAVRRVQSTRRRPTRVRSVSIRAARGSASRSGSIRHGRWVRPISARQASGRSAAGHCTSVRFA